MYERGCGGVPGGPAQAGLAPRKSDPQLLSGVGHIAPELRRSMT